MEFLILVILGVILGAMFLYFFAVGLSYSIAIFTIAFVITGPLTLVLVIYLISNDITIQGDYIFATSAVWWVVLAWQQERVVKVNDYIKEHVNKKAIK